MKSKVAINDDKDLEKEADIMGAKAMQMKPYGALFTVSSGVLKDQASTSNQ